MRLARAVKELTELVRHKGRDIQVMCLEAEDRGSGERERERDIESDVTSCGWREQGGRKWGNECVVAEREVVGQALDT